jgi:hypothetical protein
MSWCPGAKTRTIGRVFCPRFRGMNGNEIGVFELKMPNFDPQQKWRRLFVNQWWE